MTTTRRDTLKLCLLMAVGTAILPACMQDKKKPSVALKNFHLEEEEEQLLAEISETILPATNTPGAKDALIPAFVLIMLDDLYTKEEQQQFVKSMRDFAKLARKNFDKPFTHATAPQREELLSTLLSSTGKDGSESITAFVTTMKKLTVQGYTFSRYYLTKVRVYELVPGRFHGCVPVAAQS